MRSDVSEEALVETVQRAVDAQVRCERARKALEAAKEELEAADDQMDSVIEHVASLEIDGFFELGDKTWKIDHLGATEVAVTKIERNAVPCPKK